MVNIIDDDFKEYIRANNSLSEPYKAFMVTLNRGTPIPSFDISLDGTYTNVSEHIKSVLCFCYNDEDCFCFVKNYILNYVTTSNPSDDTHERNWGYQRKEKQYNIYCLLHFGFNPFNNEGKYNVNNGECSIYLDVRDEVIHIDLNSKINNVNSYHLQGIYRYRV